MTTYDTANPLKYLMPYIDNSFNTSLLSNHVELVKTANLATTGNIPVQAQVSPFLTLISSSTGAIPLFDNVQPVLGTKILVMNQTVMTQNGLYYVSNVGSVTTNWVLTRVPDYVTTTQITAGSVVYVQGGQTLQGSYYQTSSNVVLGSTAILFSTGVGPGSTWTVPNNVSTIKVTVIGGGGGAYGFAPLISQTMASLASGGGAGGVCKKTISVTPGTVLNYVIGNGGVNGSGNTAPTSGGTSIFGLNTQTNQYYCLAYGGGAGLTATQISGFIPGGSSGYGIDGSLQPGLFTNLLSTNGSSAYAAKDTGVSTVSGSGGSTVFGPGAQSVSVSANATASAIGIVGLNGINFGSGASGAAVAQNGQATTLSYLGGNGAPGNIIIEY